MSRRKTDESDIQRFAGLAGIRKKPTVYVGPMDNNGLWTICREPLDNCVDIFLKGENSSAHLVVADDAYYVLDTGNGIPVGQKVFEDERGRKEKLSTLYVVTGMTHGGTNFDSADISRGTHGVGLKATNALSKEFSVWTKRDGVWWSIHYAKGRLVSDVKKERPPELPHEIKHTTGTIVRFIPELPLFLPKTKISESDITEWCRMTSYLAPGLKVSYTNKQGKTQVWESKNGCAEFLDHQFKALGCTTEGKTFTFNSKELDLALAFTNAEGDNLQSYTNGLRNLGGGQHAEALYKALDKSLAPYKGKLDYTPADLKEGLVGLVNAKLAAPQFNTQTKDKLIDSRVFQPAFDQLLPALTDFWLKNKTFAKQVVTRAAELRRRTADFLNDKKLIKGVKSASKGISTKLAGIAGNSKIPVSEREVFLVEGESAGGSAKIARNKTFQAVFSLKGKPLNVMETTKDKVNANKEIAAIFAGIGLDLSVANPLGNLAYGRIIFLADPDVDGPLVGSTKVLLLDGTRPTIRQLAARWEKDQTPFYVYSRNAKGKLVPALAENPRVTQTVEQLVELTLDSGKPIKCSINHKWVINPNDPNDPRITWYLGNAYVASIDLHPGDLICASSDLAHHVVVSVQLVRCDPTEVFCLTVPATGNFMIDDGNGNGVCSANCHINVLLMTLFWKYMPSLYKEGRIFVLKSPEYMTRYKGKVYFDSSVQQLQKQVGTDKIEIRHIKGWGEIEASDMQPIAFDPDVRELIRINPPKGKDGILKFQQLMGKKPQFRQQLLGVLAGDTDDQD